MKATRSAGQLAVALLLSPLASAWPSWPRWLPGVDTVVVRADSTTSSATSATPTGTGSQASTQTSTGPTASDTSQPATSTNLNTGGLSSSGSGTVTVTGSGNSTTSQSPTHTSFNATDPAASIVMLTPATTTGTALYMIGEYVTWGWNYTNLLGTPTAIDVLVSCSTASETWTLTQNMTFATQGSFTWDTNAYQQTAVASPLLTEMYTLIIYDADSSISATSEPGYLGTFDQFTFGLYQLSSYTPLSQWVCVTCSAAASDLDRRALGAAVAMSVLTVLSFTWFVTGFGVFV